MFTMFSISTKESIKIALAVSIAILVAISLGLDKPYWAAITCIVISTVEGSSIAINKWHNRLFGTCLAIFFATLFTMIFPQEPELYIVALTLLLGVSVVMSAEPRYGYIFALGFPVTVLLSAMGNLDGVALFETSVLRLQETVVGVIVYSTVFRLLWPLKPEDNFISLFDEVRAQLIEAMETNDQVSRRKICQDIKTKTSNLRRVLFMPLGDSVALKEYSSNWKVRTQELAILIDKVDTLDGKLVSDSEVKRRLEVFDPEFPCDSFLIGDNEKKSARKNALKRPEGLRFKQLVKQGYGAALKSVGVFLCCVLLWIYAPIPGGTVFPLLGALLASILPLVPLVAIPLTAISVIGFGLLFLTEYVLLLPMMTEAWQLGLFYFINAFIVCQVFSHPKLSFVKVLGLDLLVGLTSGAVMLIPTYDVIGPMLTIVNVLLLLTLFALVLKLLNTKTSSCG